MADDDRRAEIEAVARLEYERSNAEPWTPGHGSLPAFDDVPDDRKAAQALGPYGDACWNRKQQARREVGRIAAALDRVRDARGDDETDRLANDLAGDWRDCLPMRRPEQPPPDALGGQPPAEPENP